MKNKRYLTENPTWHEEDSPWKARHIFSMLKKHNLHPKSIAEIGSGAGEILRQLSLALPEEVHFSGYDISPQAYALAQKKETNRLTFYCEDLLQKTESRFDLLLAIDVIEHVEDYFSFLRNLKEKSTYTIFHIPLDISVQSVLRPASILKRRNQVGHIHLFTKETALAGLADAGYEIIDSFYTASAVDLPKSALAPKLAKYPRKILFSLNQDFTVRLLGGYSLLVLAK